MEMAFGVTPYKWQEDAVSHLLQMTNRRLGIAPAPVFLCQPTGGGKSLVRDTFAVTQGGITWCITPLLSLSADQKSKINMKTSENDDSALAIHLDELGTDSKRQGICKRLDTLSRQSALAVVVLCLPQAFSNHEIYRKLFKKLCDDDKLKLLCVDEVHLFVQFGLFFREEFILLFEHVFQHLVSPTMAAHHLRSRLATRHNLEDATTFTRAPVLFMTATATPLILEQLRRITGFTFLQRNVFWPSAAGMMKKKI
jgi:superfamily II DNA helicase RecQ